MNRIWRIGLLVERSRAFGRELCEGVITYAQDKAWEIRYLDPDDVVAARLADFDGFIARVTTRKIGRTLKATGKPVIDVFYSFPEFGFSIVKEKHEAIGKMAAEHFIDRKFVNFAYCPYGGGKTSSYCRTAYALRLKRAGHGCFVFSSAEEIAYPADGRAVIGDRIAKPKDAKSLIRWLKKLPKPVAVFCPDDLRAWQVLESCLDAGISVPSDVAVLGLDNDLLICGGTRPMLSSIDPNTREIGRAAAEALNSRLANSKSQPVIRQIDPHGVVARKSTETYPLDPPWLSDALVYINRESANGISAKDVFIHLGRSHTTVTRAFAQVLGSTVQREIARSRLETATRLLRTTSLSQNDIAKRAGFASTGYFMHAFSAAFGVSPGSWRTARERAQNLINRPLAP